MKVPLARRHGLLLCPVAVTYNGASMIIDDVLIDTGSAGTVLATDAVAELGITFAPGDLLCGIRGVGGREYVFRRKVGRLAVGGHGIDEFDVEIGAMDYGFPVNELLGVDSLTHAAAVLDLGELTLEFPRIG